MQDLRSALDPDTREKADVEMTSQVNRAFEEFIETARKLSQHSFLVNAGGATAILAFIGSNPDASFAFVPLIFFVAGVIASGLELRFLLKSIAAIHRDAMDRRSAFASDRLPLSEAMPRPDVGARQGKVSAWSGHIAQATFPLGVGLGIYAFLR